MIQKWVSIIEACHILDISKSTLYRRIQNGEIESKKEGKSTLCLITLQDESQNETDETQSGTQIETRQTADYLGKENEELRQQTEYLKQQAQGKDKQIEDLQQRLEETNKALADAGERHDTIVMQLTRQLEQSQRLLEFHQESWYRRWFKRQRRPKEKQ